jgi:hypothetical protein
MTAEARINHRFQERERRINAEESVNGSFTDFSTKYYCARIKKHLNMMNVLTSEHYNGGTSSDHSVDIEMYKQVLRDNKCSDGGGRRASKHSKKSKKSKKSRKTKSRRH